MANIVISPNMSLPVPVVGVDSGPDWANNINSCLSILDAHDHSAGDGVQITPSGMNINADLTFANNNIVSPRSVRFFSQSAVLGGASDLGCLYEVVDDLYYNDGQGNQIRITQSGAVAGTPGSIANLVAPASASYVSADATFVFQSAANVAANIDGRSFILRNSSASSFGITLSAPSLSSNYTITLPSLPASTKILQISNSGAITSVLGVDNSTIVITGNNLLVPTGGIGTTQIADGAVTQAKIAVRNVTSNGTDPGAGGFVQCAGSGTFTVGAGEGDITNQSLTITSYGNPIVIGFMPSSATLQSCFAGGTNSDGYVKIYDGATGIANFWFGTPTSGGLSQFPPSSVQYIYPAAAGTYTFKGALAKNGGLNVQAINVKMYAYEMK